MSEEREQTSVAFWATAVTIVAIIGISGYAAAYLCMARQPIVYFGGEVLPRYVVGGYKLDQVFWKDVFAPAHWVDRRIRPEKWAKWHGFSRVRLKL